MTFDGVFTHLGKRAPIDYGALDCDLGDILGDIDATPAIVAHPYAGVELNEAQAVALVEIVGAYQRKAGRWLLSGFAGAGKTTLMQAVACELLRLGAQVVVAAPTHKAVAVIRRKLDEAGLVDVPTRTIQSLLGLRVAPDGERTKLVRSSKSIASTLQVVIIDECSMIDSGLQAFIDQDLMFAFVLYVGDPAQLPPVGEIAAPCFATKGRSNLATIVRQAEGNPILKAATAIRTQQGGRPDWSWCQEASDGAHGVFVAGNDAEGWMREAFCSPEFAANNDTFRYLCWTNARVADVNARVRNWIYGDTPTPFVAGENVLIRQPIQGPDGFAFNTNEEAEVAGIDLDTHVFKFPSHVGGFGAKAQALEAFAEEMEVWRIALKHPIYQTVEVLIPRYEMQRKNLDQRLCAEAKLNSSRWYERFEFTEKLAKLQSVYALTIHTSQGSTVDNCFMDMQDLRKREMSDPLECLKLAYVGLTRARFAVILVGVAR